MVSNFIACDEFERRFSDLTGHVDHSIDQVKVVFVTELRASELRIQEKIEAFRQRTDIEMA